MSINCRINNGTVEAQNGMASILYKSLEKKFGKNQAMDYYALTESEDYIENTVGKRDMNGEMSFFDFMTFVTKRESERDFSQETLELQLITNDFSNIDKLYDSGVFNPSKRNLMASGLFTVDEAENITYSKERQENLRIFLDNLNLDENIEPISEFRVKSTETNAIGIKPLLNPEEVKKEDLSNEEIQIIRPENQTFNTIMNTLDVLQLSEVENAAYRISQFANRELIIEEFDNLQDSFIDAGLDIPISDIELNNKTTEWLQNFANETLKFSQDISEESTKEFATFLDSIIQRPEISIESLETDKPATFRKYESLNDEVTDFNEKSLIKHSDGLYQSVKTDYSLNELYEGLYNKVKKDNTLIPINLSQAEISDEINKEEVLEDIKSHILSNIDTLPQTDTETAEKIIALKILTKAPIKNTENYKVPTGEEVAEDFVSEFNKERLDHKRRNTPTYNRFYKFLKVDHMGIRPIDLGDFTRLHIIKNVPNNIKDKLTNYFSQNKNTIFDMSEETPPIENIERVVALNNPFSISKITSDYSIESENEIVTMEDSEFIRVRDEVYEKVMSNGENNLYKKVTNITRPITNKKPNFLNSFNKTQENTIEYKKYLTKKDLEEINNKHFNCT